MESSVFHPSPQRPSVHIMKGTPNRGPGHPKGPKSGESRHYVQDAEEAREYPYKSSQKNQGMRTPVSKSRVPSTPNSSTKGNLRASEELFSIDAVGGLLSEVSISASSPGPRSSPSGTERASYSPSQRYKPTPPRNFNQNSHGSTGGRTPNGKTFRPSYDASSPTSQRAINTMVSSGGVTTTKVSIYVNASRCKLDAKRVSELLKFIVANYITPYTDATTGARTKKLRIIKFDLSCNVIDDQAVNKLVGFFRQNADSLIVNSLKLYQNKIGDAGCEAIAQLLAREDGPTLHELHLSHNRITTRGALSLMKALGECPRYPFETTQEKKLTPLWLRLEHNFIAAESIISFLSKEKIETCQVNAKGSSCTPSSCQHANAKMHLVFIHFQYWNEALESAKRAMESLRTEQLQESSDSPNSGLDTLEDGRKGDVEDNGEKSNDAKGEKGESSTSLVSSLPNQSDEIQRPISSVVGTPKVDGKSLMRKTVSAGPLYLFMDTNAVVTAVLEPKHPWSFENLSKRFGTSLKGGRTPQKQNSESKKSSASESARDETPNSNNVKEDPRSRVVLVVTDTVLGELDGMHKKKIIKASVVNSLLMEAERQGYLMMLGAHQGEKLVQALDAGHSQLGLDVTTSNDRMIVDIALMFAEALGDSNCAMFISEDHGARLAARNRGLCVVSMSQLQTVLPKHAKETWSSLSLRTWFLEAAPTKSTTDSPSSRGSAAPTLSNSNPISQLRTLKSHTLKAKQISESMECATPELKDKQQQLNGVLLEMERILKNIALLPGLNDINGVSNEESNVKSSSEEENQENTHEDSEGEE